MLQNEGKEFIKIQSFVYYIVVVEHSRAVLQDTWLHTALLYIQTRVYHTNMHLVQSSFH